MNDNTDVEADDALYGHDDQIAAEEAFFAWVETQPDDAVASEINHHLDGMLHHLGVLERAFDRRQRLAAAHVEAAAARARRYVERGDLPGRIVRLRNQFNDVVTTAVAASKVKTLELPSGTIKTRTVDTWHWDNDEVLLKQLVDAGLAGLIRPETSKTVVTPAAVDKVAVKKTATVLFDGDIGSVVIDGEVLPMVTVEKTTSVDVTYAADLEREVTL